mmetsp:Transcript_41926/g.110481  ORF Transcript_41926/g.110481 Transcript_41926/m.110481 type:complete len:229 (+) Transcript_41926:520-1206(+)
MPPRHATPTEAQRERYARQGEGFPKRAGKRRRESRRGKVTEKSSLMPQRFRRVRRERGEKEDRLPRGGERAVGCGLRSHPPNTRCAPIAELAAEVFTQACCRHPAATSCSSSRSTNVTTRRLISRARSGGTEGGGSTRLGAKTVASDLNVMRFVASCLAISDISRSSHSTVARCRVGRAQNRAPQEAPSGGGPSTMGWRHGAKTDSGRSRNHSLISCARHSASAILPN